MSFYLYTPIVFLYIFSVEFIFTPFGLGSRALIGLIGLIYVAIDQLNKLSLHKIFYAQTFILIFMVFLIFISSLVNQVIDTSFLKYPASILLVVSGAYFIVKTSPNFRNFNKFESFHVYIIAIGALQATLSVAMFFNPVLSDLLNSLQKKSAFEENLVETFLSYRLLGFGANFFTLGIFYSICLLSLVFLLFERARKISSIIFLCILFVFFTSIGLSMSRSTFIGLIFSFIFMLLIKIKPNDIRHKWKLTKFLFSSLGVTALAASPLLLNEVFFSKIQPLLTFSFELLINFFEQGRLESASTSHLLSMYEIDIDWKTFFIGDGLFIDPINPLLYYRETDVGYIRIVLYFGVFGLFSYISFQAFPLWFIHSYSTIPTYKIYSLVLFYPF